MRLAVGLIAGVLAVYAAGCEDGQDSELTPSPTPPEVYGQSMEDRAWEGWFFYADDQLQVHTYLIFSVLEYKDGLWCGALIQDYTRAGAYLGYATLAGWNEVVNNDGSNVEEYGSIVGRVYGELMDSGDMKGWIDSINDSTLEDPASTPVIDESSRDFVTRPVDSSNVLLDPDTLTSTEVIELMGDAIQTSSGSTTGDTTATQPTFAAVDLPPVLLSNEIVYNQSALELQYCLWAFETSNAVPAHHE